MTSFVQAVKERYLTHTIPNSHTHTHTKPPPEITRKDSQGYLIVPKFSALWGPTTSQDVSPVFYNQNQASKCLENLKTIVLDDSTFTVAAHEHETAFFERMATLEINANQSINDLTEIFHILSLCPRLESLQIRNTPKLFQLASKSLPEQSFRSIKYLCISENINSNPAEIAETVRQVVKTCPDLETLNISANNLTQSHMDYILGNNNTITTLDISHNSVTALYEITHTANVLDLIAYNNPLGNYIWPSPLKKLNLRQCGLSDLVDLYNVAAAHPGLEDLKVTKNPLFETAVDAEQMRLVKIACFPNLTTSDGEIITQRIHREADLYYISLFKRRVELAKFFPIAFENILKNAAQRQDVDLSLFDEAPSLARHSFQITNVRIKLIHKDASFSPVTINLTKTIITTSTTPRDIKTVVSLKTKNPQILAARVSWNSEVQPKQESPCPNCIIFRKRYFPNHNTGTISLTPETKTLAAFGIPVQQDLKFIIEI